MKRTPIILSVIVALSLIVGMALPIAAQTPVEPPVVKAEIPKNGVLIVEKQVNVEDVPPGAEVIPVPEPSERLNSILHNSTKKRVSRSWYLKRISL